MGTADKAGNMVYKKEEKGRKFKNKKNRSLPVQWDESSTKHTYVHTYQILSIDFRFLYFV